MKTFFQTMLMAVIGIGGQLHADEVTVDSLRESLQSPSVETRRAAALKLGLYRQHLEAALPELIQATKDPDEAVACRAIQTLTYLRGHQEQLLPALLNAFHSKFPSVRIAAAEAMSRLQFNDQETAFSGLLHALQDQHPIVIAAVARTLGRLDLRKVVGAQERLLNAAKPHLKSSDERILGGVAGMLAWQKTAPELALPVLVNLLDSKSRRVRREALSSVQRYGELAKEVAPIILLQMEKTDEHHRHHSGRTVLSIDPENGEAALIEVLQKSRVQLAREGAVRTLAYQKTETAFDAIAGALRDHSANVRYYACLAIQRTGLSSDTAKENLRYILRHDRSSVVKTTAKETLDMIQ